MLSMHGGAQALRLGDLEPASGAGESGVRENVLRNLHDLGQRSRAAAQAHLLYFTYTVAILIFKKYLSNITYTSNNITWKYLYWRFLLVAA